MLVVDASTVITGCLSEAGFAGWQGRDLRSPFLLWSESTSVLHELRWRKQISARLASIAFERLQSVPIEQTNPPGLPLEAWKVADRLGWARTYDAEYVALARLLSCKLVTSDQRLQRGASRIVDVIDPADLSD